jgi:hypothetical protein
VARDLQGATLMQKLEAMDPLEHPWLFYADSRRSRDGADRLKFDARTAPASGAHATDLAVVAYWLEPGDADDLRLVRWSSPALPEGLDRELPRSSDDGAQIVASGLTRFGVRFTDDEGAVVSAWDSSTVERSGKLPVAAEITLALRDASAPEGERAFAKRVLLPTRPIDLEQELSGESKDEDDDEDEDDAECTTVRECQAANASVFAAGIAQAADPASIQAALDANGDMCWEDLEAQVGFDFQVDCE